jgi:formate dehydrogenase iron-sulfur subunit
MALLGIAPTSLGSYVADGGLRGLERALSSGPAAVIEEVTGSGLRGRGGAGFPTGEKWRAIRDTGSGIRYAVCNAAEGEPATFKDRLLMRTNPYEVLEGLAIAAYAVGAERAYEVGSGLGAGGFAVFDESACIVRVAALFSRFLYVESCGQCPPCKLGSGVITDLLDRVERGEGDIADLDTVLARPRP